MTPRRTAARVRRRAAALMWRAALGPVAGAVPRRYVRSIVEQAGSQPVAAHLEDLVLLEAAHVEQYELEPALPPEFRRSKAFDDRYVYRLRDVCVSPRTGLCWLPEGLVLEESYGGLIRLLGWGSAALDDTLLRSRHRLDGPVIGLPADGYFHWLLEALPAALHALEHEPAATLLVPARAPRYVEDALVLLGVENVVRLDEPVRVDRLVLTARNPFSGFVSREDVEVLRRRLASVEAASGPAAMYVSRRKQARRPGNEAEVEDALEQLGFQVVLAEELSFREQIGLFGGARMVVGPHGAGLANLVWSRRLSWLGEIFATRHFNDCYARLASLVGADYSAFRSRASRSRWGHVAVDDLASAVSRSSRAPREQLG